MDCKRAMISHLLKSLAMGWKPGVQFPARVEFLFITTSFLVLEPTQPPIQMVPGVKWLGREGDYSPSSSAHVKNVWSFTSTHLHVLHGVVLKHCMNEKNSRNEVHMEY